MTEEYDLSEYPLDLRTYIEKQHRLCVDGNTADFRGTFQDELDDITRDYISRWNRGQVLIAGMNDQEHRQCRALYRWKIGNLAEYSEDRLVNGHFEEGQCLVPSYVTQLEMARYLQPYFAVPTPSETATD